MCVSIHAQASISSDTGNDAHHLKITCRLPRMLGLLWKGPLQNRALCQKRHGTSGSLLIVDTSCGKRRSIKICLALMTGGTDGPHLFTDPKPRELRGCTLFFCHWPQPGVYMRTCTLVLCACTCIHTCVCVYMYVAHSSVAIDLNNAYGYTYLYT